MASIQQRGSRWQLRVVNKLLPRPFFQSFDSESAARNYGEQLEGWLSAGIVPPGLFDAPGAAASPLVSEVIRAYTLRGSPSPSTSTVLDVVLREVVGLRLSELTFLWAEGYVKALKAREKKPTPGTIRKRIGALARALDWYHIAEAHKREDGVPMPVNVLRLLPDGYSLYADNEVRDAKRDVRFGPGDEERIAAALAGVKREGRERPWGDDPAFRLLFELIVDTGLRLREAYWLRVGQLEGEKGILRVDGTKGHRGIIKPRVVPLKRELRAKLIAWCEGKQPGELIFPFWDGTPGDLPKCSSRMSNRFATLFEYAEVTKFTEHDLRHEACCRWVMLRDANNRWMFNDTEICKIMGWEDPKILLRYASLRAEDLSLRLL
ncbi:site-specific integrase [Pantoea sp. 18069]|uniref:site-specific integrase n=1 Tax=Pantoea sp. 18069 TaxID=2681415 RepID=UPI001357D27D|nr:site-specific integrase [Pantoea sp. 18069]